MIKIDPARFQKIFTVLPLFHQNFLTQCWHFFNNQPQVGHIHMDLVSPPESDL